MTYHSKASNRHKVHEWEYADAAARAAATGFTSDDLSKWAKQLDTGDFYELTATTPTWALVAGSTTSHSAVTLAADADTVLSLSTQQIGLDNQTANTVFAGPTGGGAADPTFRALVLADLPALPSGYPFDVITVDLTDTDADYATLADALAACSGGETVVLGPGTFTADNILLPDGVNIVGQGIDTTIITDSLNTTPQCFRIASPSYPLRLYNLSITIDVNNAGNDVCCINVTSGLADITIVDCSLSATNSNGATENAYTFRGVARLYLYGGYYDAFGDTLSCMSDGSAVIQWASGLPYTYYTTGLNISGSSEEGLYYDGFTNQIKAFVDNPIFAKKDSTTDISTALSMARNTTGTPTAGSTGVQMAAYVETSTTENTLIGAIAWWWDVVTHASRRAAAVIYGYYISTKIELAVFTAPDIAATAGGTRGKASVDLQSYKTSSTHIPSGAAANILGGELNIASGDVSSVVNGVSNVASGTRSFVANGSTNVAAGDGSAVLGGDNNTANVIYSSVLPGRYAKSTIRSQVSHAGTRFAADGDGQATISIHLLRSVTHSDANWYTLYPDGTGTYLLDIPVDTVWTFDCLIVGTTQGCTKSFGFSINGVIENDGGTTTMLATTPTTLYDTDDVSFDAQAVANNSFDLLEIQVKDADAAGDVVRWSATLKMAQVTFPA